MVTLGSLRQLEPERRFPAHRASEVLVEQPPWEAEMQPGLRNSYHRDSGVPDPSSAPASSVSAIISFCGLAFSEEWETWLPTGQGLQTPHL